VNLFVLVFQFDLGPFKRECVSISIAYNLKVKSYEGYPLNEF